MANRFRVPLRTLFAGTLAVSLSFVGCGEKSDGPTSVGTAKTGATDADPAGQIPADIAEPDPAALRRAWGEPTEPKKLVGPIHYVGTKELAAYLIPTSEGLILLDGAMPSSAPLVEASIRKLGFDPEQIRLLLITHAHVDHVGTLAHFRKLCKAAVVAMAPDDALLASGGSADYLYANDPDFHFEPVKADRVVVDGEKVTLGDVTLVARRTAGHTRGCTTWTTTVEDDGRWFRVVFAGSTGVNPGTRLVLDPSYPGILGDYRDALDTLDSLPLEIFFTAHASQCDLLGKIARSKTLGVTAFVDPAGYHRLLGIQRRQLESLAAMKD